MPKKKIKYGGNRFTKLRLNFSQLYKNNSAKKTWTYPPTIEYSYTHVICNL